MVKEEKDMKENNRKQAMFVKTQDLTTAEGLKRAGFDLVDYADGTWTFINNPDCPLTFDNNKVAYSNMLCF